MPFTDATWAVDGAEITGQLYRLQLHSATYGGKGIISPTDLEVRELSTPGTSVRILSGGCVIAGDAVAFQGSYYGHSVGQEELPIASTGSGETRSDLIIVQAHDSTYAGSPFTEDPSTDRIVYPEVIPNVGPSATTTSEPNAIVLARIDMPESTGTVTQDLIMDLRRPLILNPFFQDSIWHGSGTTTVAAVDWEIWPNSTVTVDVPSWAIRMDVACSVPSVRMNANGASTPNYFGNIQHTANGEALSGIGEFNHEWPGGVSRMAMGHNRTYSAIPYQGTNVQLQLEVRRQGRSAEELLQADNGTSVVWQIYFRQEATFTPNVV